jgi:hypothetical protein
MREARQELKKERSQRREKREEQHKCGEREATGSGSEGREERYARQGKNNTTI